MTLRRLALLAFLPLAALACGGRQEAEAVQASATGTLDVVRTNSSLATIGLAPLMIADEEGFFEAEGIDLVFEKIDSASSLIALSAGKLDVLSDPVRSGLFNVILKGAPIRVVADRGHAAPGPCSSQSFAAPVAIAERVARSGYKGEKFVLIRGGTTEYVIDRLLEKNGLTRADVDYAQIVPTGDQVSQRLEAIRLMLEPNLSNVVIAGTMKVVARTDEIVPHHQLSVLAFGPRLVRDDRALGIRFMRAYLRGVRQYLEGKTERNVDIVARGTALPAEIIRRSCWPAIAADGRVKVEALDDFLRWARENDYLDGEIPPTAWWDPAFIDAALAD